MVKSDGFGSKTIGNIGSFALLTNNITGPGLVVLPVIYGQCGWLPTTLLIFMCMLIAGFTSMLACESMAMIPGNRFFQGRVEFGYLAKRILSPGLYQVMFWIFIFNLLTTNISAVIESSQVPNTNPVWYPRPPKIRTIP